MATPHPGKWELLLTSAKCELSTVDPAVHAAVIANRNTGAWKVLYWKGGPPYQSFLWNPKAPTQVGGPQIVPNWPGQDFGPPDLFCSGHAHMEDGKLLVAGGQRPEDPGCPDGIRGIPYTYLFDPLTEEWSAPGTAPSYHPMADGRWYPTLTTLGEGPGYGKVLAMSGFRKDLSNCNSVVNKDPEMYTPTGANAGWSMMADPTQAVQPFNDLYTGAHVVPYGPHARKVFYASPMTQARVFDPYFAGESQETGYWTSIGQVRAAHRDDGNSVLLPLLPGATTAKELIVGGGNPALKTAEVMDVAGAAPSWSSVAPMFLARRNANAILLPDDRVLVVGGDEGSGAANIVYTAEVYDVAANAWTLLPAMNRPRIYHSTAVLLPDGRVWAAGTLADGLNERNVELYSPGYLFEGQRPVFSTAPSVIHYGTTFTIGTSPAIVAIRLIRLSAVTHSTNMDQRSVVLKFTSGGGAEGPTYTVTAPANANVAPPGMYMLFVLRAKSASLSGETMIPSVAKIVQVKKP